ncbi:MAG: 1-deoxy-D-xylulose-5-phosphate reductoisomerase [Rhodospirillales bacterium]|nr:1-deoxy-D-xylulose-5-phosphate reductoisomerase [Rhodospirillales bacterium]
MAVTSVVPQAAVIECAAHRTITILGSTGSIGSNTVDLVLRNPGAFEVEALTAHSNAAKLARQARELRPKLAVVADPGAYAELKEALSGTDVEAAAGPDAVVAAAARPAEWVMAAIVGAAGLQPTLAAARRGAVVALANKECLVCAGELMMGEVRRHGATLLPVDSEHSAIFQVFDFEQPEKVERIILTASGGPFRTFDYAAMADVTPSQAVAHPNWDMGAKISVDSATMMNKGLELIEAHHLFGLPEERIEILVHPQSVIHSLVAYVDGSVLAQLGTPDMRTPIAYALGWPRRMDAPAARLDLAALGSLTFEAPDLKRFPALRLARQALRSGGGAPTVFNAANEVAVQAFLAGRIGFLDIAAVVEDTMDRMGESVVTSLDDVIEIDCSAREAAGERARMPVGGIS